MALSPNSRFGRYEIHSLLGKGGMGEVYLAQDTTLRRPVAIKLLPSDFTHDDERLHRFEREAHAASSLNHPNILTIHEVGAEDGTHFIAAEYVEGESLRRRLARARMGLREALDAAIQIASALAAAHRAGIVHRDIKPENIMLRPDGYVKVLDFGLAKLVGHKPPALNTEAPTEVLARTAPGVVMGTTGYMSPEQARGKEVDARTDIWSLGVVLYEMVTGRLPFEGETASDVIAAILKTEPPPLVQHPADVPRELEHIVTKALRKDREERYQHIKDLMIDLRDLKQELEFEEKLGRSARPSARGGSAAASGGANAEAAQTGGAGDIHTTSSAEYIVTRIKHHKRGALLVLAAVVAATVAVAYFAGARYSAGSGTGTIDSVAVLPFANATGDPEAEYLSDGISESLINSLSQLPNMKVIARSSAFRYKGKEVDPQEVARALGVEAILTGRVAQRGENLLISAELVDARDETQMWGEQYNRHAADLLQVQAEISKEIAEKLRLRLSAGERQQLAKRETANPQAYELVLKGRFHRSKGGTESHKKAVEYFNQAVAVDPTYALAYAELSISYRRLVADSVLEPEEFTPAAAAAARKALELDEGLAEAHYALALIKQDAWDRAAAEREFNRAIGLNPNLARAHFGYSIFLSYIGRHEQAIAEIKRARELDPLSPGVNVRVGYILFFARQYDQAIEALKKALELDQNFPYGHGILGHTYAAKGMYAEAIAAYQEEIKLGGESSSRQIALGAAYAQAGERERARAILKRLQASERYVSPGELAILYASLGEREQAFASLEKAYAARDLQLQFLGVEPGYDSLRADQRFADLMRRVGLPQ